MGLAEDNKDNISSLHNNGCPKLSCVVVNEHDNIDNKDNNSSLLNYGCPKLSCVVVIKKEMA